MSGAYVSAFCPLGAAVTLEGNWYDRHGFRDKIGPAIASVFEIERAIKEPNEIIISKADTNSRIYVRPVGTYKTRQWYTIVIAVIENGTGFISTVYNAQNYSSKGNVIWSANQQL